MNLKTSKTQFPIFKHHPNLVYLDNAATSQKPRSVIARVKKFYEEENANIHRGIYQLSEKATQEYEAVRVKIAKFIGVRSSKEVIFTSGATGAINLVASSWGSRSIKVGDELVLTEMEHHSNLVPWQNLRITSQLKFIPITADGQLDLAQLPKLITKKTKLVTLTYISNVLGTINPVGEIVRLVKRLNPRCLVLVDAAQAVPHLPVDVQALGCDFLVFSAHKMLGPTGVGVLWARSALLEKMEPYQFGGGMISEVEQHQSKWAEIPQKFEAGTPNIAGVIGLGAAIDFLEKIGMTNICRHEEELTVYALERLLEMAGLTIYGPKRVELCSCACGKCQFCVKCQKGGEKDLVETTSPAPLPACKGRLGIISFNIKGVHAHDVAQVLAGCQIAVRAGHHCAMPLHRRLGVPATVRASFYLYNTTDDVDLLVQGIKRVLETFSVQ